MTDCSGGVTSFIVTPTMSEKGRHDIAFIVSDGESSDSFILTIDAVDSPPYFKTAFNTTYESFINISTSYNLPEIGEY
jgi:hypothetical protein